MIIKMWNDSLTIGLL